MSQHNILCRDRVWPNEEVLFTTKQFNVAT